MRILLALALFLTLLAPLTAIADTLRSPVFRLTSATIECQIRNVGKKVIGPLTIAILDEGGNSVSISDPGTLDPGQGGSRTFTPGVIVGLFCEFSGDFKAKNVRAHGSVNVGNTTAAIAEAF